MEKERPCSLRLLAMANTTEKNVVLEWHELRESAQAVVLTFRPKSIASGS